MNFQLWTPLISAVLALAITGKVLLRSRKRRAHWLFIMFAANVAVWYLATFVEYQAGSGPLLGRFTAVMAVLLPQTGVRFLEAFTAAPQGAPSALHRWASRLFFVALAAVMSPWFDQRFAGAIIRAGIAAYVVGLLIAAVSALYTGGRAAPSRMERRRALYLVGVGVAATVVTTADLVPFTINRIVPGGIPPLGSVLVLAVLYMFSEVVERRRLIDLYELAGRFAVLTALALVLAGIYYRLVDWQVIARSHLQEGPYFLNAIVASLVILIVFDPLRAKVEEQAGRIFFSERFDLDRSITALRNRVAHTLELEPLGRALMEGLEGTRRVTSAALYLLDVERRGLDLFAHLGAAPEARRDIAPLRALVDHMEARGAAVRELVEREEDDRRELAETREADALAELGRTLDELGAGVVLPLQGEGGELLGLLVVCDDRVRDAFSPDEVHILRGLAAQVSVVVENSRLHARSKERDRLAALGEMAAGLAHEIRNPLGAIKAAAQVMEGSTHDDAQRDLLGVITEEVGRLDRVVSSFLDYARPYRGNPSSFDLAQVVERTMRLARGDLPAGVALTVDVGADLPPVRMDPEHLRQVLFNLVRNAVEAMGGEGSLTVTATTRARAPFARTGDDAPPEWVELHVRDTGPGIAADALRNLFIPFFTTKPGGTGLGLAICQRLVESAGGRIRVRSSPGAGTTFTVSLPVVSPTATDPDVLGRKRATESPSARALSAPPGAVTPGR